MKQIYTVFSIIHVRNKPATDIYEGRAENHEQLFFACDLGTADKDSAVVDETSCCVILECLVTSIACIT